MPSAARELAPRFTAPPIAPSRIDADAVNGGFAQRAASLTLGGAVVVRAGRLAKARPRAYVARAAHLPARNRSPQADLAR